MTDSTNAKGVTEILQSGVRGLLVSPYSKVEKGALRMDVITKIIPELVRMGKADNELELELFPKLKHVIQNSHASIDGTIKYKHFTVYPQPSLNTNTLPTINTDENCAEFFYESGEVKKYTHKEVLDAAMKFERKDYGQYHSLLSTLPFSSPLTLTSGMLSCFFG